MAWTGSAHKDSLHPPLLSYRMCIFWHFAAADLSKRSYNTWTPHVIIEKKKTRLIDNHAPCGWRLVQQWSQSGRIILAAKKKQKTKRLGQIRIRFFEEEKKTSLCLLLLQTLCDGNKNNNRCGGVGKPQKEWVDRFNDDELHFLIWSFECNGQRFEPFTPPPPFFLQTFRYSLWGFFCIHTSSCFWGRTSFLALGSSVWFSVLQMQLERLLARQMEILQDAAVQERLQALDWRIPPAALKYLSDAQNTNGVAAADVSRDGQGRTSFIPRNFTSAPSHTLILANLEFGLHPFPFSFSPTHIQAITFDVAVLRKPAQT